MKCPRCKIEMIKRASKFGNNYWWGCPNFPRCRITSNEHPDGTTMSTPADIELKQLRRKAHTIAEDLWGKWYDIKKDAKEAMYSWLRENTKSGHIGLMDKEEILDTIKQLKEIN